MISGNMVGSYSTLGKTLLLVDSDGNELTGVVVDQETVFTAGDNDVREGKVYASDSGVSTGTKDIPAYRTTQGVESVDPGSSFSILLEHHNKFDYTQLQCIICPMNNKVSDSCACEKISLNDSVYEVNSTNKLSDVTKNSETKSIDLNIVNNTDNIYLIFYFTYREEI